MKPRIKKYGEGSPVEFLLLREQLGMRRYRKRSKRDEEKRKILFKAVAGHRDENDRNDIGYFDLSRALGYLF
jgi:hypothetical protein